jgi:hypothetical protein
MSDRQWFPKKEAWLPVDYDDDVVLAVRAVKSGVANQGQQQLFYEWLRYLCGADDWAFRPGRETRETDIMLGRQFVWSQVEKMNHPALTPKAREKPQITTARGGKSKRPAKLKRPPRKTEDK